MDDVTADRMQGFGQLPSETQIETDLFCAGCGYNLHGQIVRRDPGTKLLLARCSECGDFASATDVTTAGRVWLRRLATWMVALWVLAAIVIFLAPPFFQWITDMVVTDDLPRYQRWALQRPKSAAHYAEQAKIVWMVCVPLSVGWGLLSGFSTVVLIPHWRRWGYLVAVVILPIVAGVACWAVWRIDRPDEVAQAIPRILWLTLCNIPGGIVGVFVGRPFARLMVRLILLPRVRSPLAYLWRVDGKVLPSAKG